MSFSSVVTFNHFLDDADIAETFFNCDYIYTAFTCLYPRNFISIVESIFPLSFYLLLLCNTIFVFEYICICIRCVGGEINAVHLHSRLIHFALDKMFPFTTSLIDI